MGESISKEIINDDNQEYFDLINRKIKNETPNPIIDNSNGKKKKILEKCNFTLFRKTI